jgi:hypothetical protein
MTNRAYAKNNGDGLLCRILCYGMQDSWKPGGAVKSSLLGQLLRKRPKDVWQSQTKVNFLPMFQ